jgi:hypothetical protein
MDRRLSGLQVRRVPFSARLAHLFRWLAIWPDMRSNLSSERYGRYADRYVADRYFFPQCLSFVQSNAGKWLKYLFRLRLYCS